MNAFKVSPSRNVSGFLKPSPSGRGLGEGDVSNLTLAIHPPAGRGHNAECFNSFKSMGTRSLRLSALYAQSPGLVHLFYALLKLSPFIRLLNIHLFAWRFRGAACLCRRG